MAKLPCFEISIRGENTVPETGPVIVAAKHSDARDIPILGIAVKRQMHYMAKDSLFRIPVLGWWMKKVEAFAVNRGRIDRNAIQTGRSYVEQGEIVCMFPEGTRKNPPNQIGPLHGYIAMIAQGAKVKPRVCTVAAAYAKVRGWLGLPKWKIAVEFGRPILPDEVGEDRDVFMNLVEERMAPALNEAVRIVNSL